MSSSYNIAVSAFFASQRGLDLAGQNIANASTPGYHRQVVELSPRTLGGEIGAGVDVTGVIRHVDKLLEQALVRSGTATGKTSVELDVMRQLESVVSTADGGIPGQLENFFNEVEKLSSQPASLIQRRVLVGVASDLAGELNRVSQSISDVRTGLQLRIEQTVDEINSHTARIADLNLQIQRVESGGGQANELRDQRDQHITELAKLIDVQTIDQPYGVVNVVTGNVQSGNVPAVVGSLVLSLSATQDSANQTVITAKGASVPVTVTGGELAGLIEARNQILTDYDQRLDDWARELAQRVNTVQATGLGLDGSFTALTGETELTSTTLPLASSDPAFDIQAGSLFISVTDVTTQNRSLIEVAIDPATQSLQDLATAITTATGGNVQASATATGRLELLAQPGFTFDFAGRVPTTPVNLAINGTASPQVTGVYRGEDNDLLSFQVVGSGDVGVTPGLTLEARDGGGNLIASLNIGEGYVPGSPLSLGNGLSIQIGAGTTNNGSFDVPVTGRPDTSGILSALGVRSFFSGNDALTLRVRAELLDDPSLLAASRSGEPGDGLNLQRLADIRDLPVLNGGTATFSDVIRDLIGNVGSDTKALDSLLTAQSSLTQNLEAQQQSVSGVDPNEELVTMLNFQRSYQVAARFMSAINSAMDELLGIIR